MTVSDEKSPSAEEMVARARALGPALIERSEDCERRRVCPEETIREFLDSGLNKPMQPARYGGYEMGWDVLCEISQELSRACASQGWVMTVFGDHAQLLGMFPGQAQDDVWGDDPQALISTAFAALGEARPVDGGHRLSGRWPFSSGIDYASWIIAGGHIVEDAASGPAELIFFLVPKGDATLIDDWHVAGLAGTGSKSFEIDDIFVPAHRILSGNDFNDGTGPGGRFNDAPVYRLPRRGPAALALASPAVGAAHGVLDEFARINSQRISRSGRMAEVHGTQLRISESASDASAARMMVLTTARDTMATLASGEPVSVDQRVLAQRNGAYAAMLACRAVDRLFAASGGHGIYLGNRIQRAFRDVHAVSAHIALGWDFAATNYGRMALGLDPVPGTY